MVFQSRNPTSVTYGTETVSYMAPKKWILKNFDSLKSFKKKKKSGNLNAHVGYVKPICNMLVLSNN